MKDPGNQVENDFWHAFLNELASSWIFIQSNFCCLQPPIALYLGVNQMQWIHLWNYLYLLCIVQFLPSPSTPRDPHKIFPALSIGQSIFPSPQGPLTVLNAFAHKVTRNMLFLSAHPPAICQKHFPGQCRWHFCWAPGCPGGMVRAGIE